MYELVDKYLRRLDTELVKFKCELEADNKGITEVLEKRSLELDTPMNPPNMSSQQKENRFERCISFRNFIFLTANVVLATLDTVRETKKDVIVTPCRIHLQKKDKQFLQYLLWRHDIIQ